MTDIGLAAEFSLDPPADRLEAEALNYATTRVALGRTAWRFTQDLRAGRGKPLD
jgi:predicted AAA+ superfamily ATPase